MLNRRVLRIKGMQTLFAYYQAKEANYLLAEDFISDSLQPNLNLDVPENKVEMAEKEKEALSLFSDWRKSQNSEIQSDDIRVKKTVNEAIVKFEDLLEKDYKNIGVRMLVEIENLYSLYFLCLQLIIEIGDLNKDNKLYSNNVIQSLRENDVFQSEITKRNLGWSNQTQLLKKLNKEVIAENEKYISYLSLDVPTEEEDVKIVNDLLKEIVFSNEELVEFFERRDLYWVENKNILRSMLKKTVKESSTKKILQISENWEDDKIFFNDLFHKTIENEYFLNDFISKQAKNWEKDRFALTDLVILKMGITEMISFSDVPLKVSINEYIEVSKSYSTPKSKQFINGMLDKASIILQKEGKIIKSGRGLIDNK